MLPTDKSLAWYTAPRFDGNVLKPVMTIQETFGVIAIRVDAKDERVW